MRIAVILTWSFAFALPVARAGDPLPEGAVMRLGDLRWRFAEHSSEAKRYAWLPDSSGIVACGKETIRLFDAKTGRVIRDWRSERGDPFMSVAVSPDGKTLAATKEYGLVYLWDVATGKQTKILALNRGVKEESCIDRIAFSPDGKRIVTESKAANPFDLKFGVQLWDVASAKLQRELKTDSKVIQVGFEGSGIAVFAVTEQEFVYWQIGQKQIAKSALKLPDPETIATRNGSWLASFEPGQIKLLNGRNGKLVGDIELEGADMPYSAGFGFGNDGRQLWTVSFPKEGDYTRLQVWSVPAGKLVREFSTGIRQIGFPLPSPDGAKVAYLRSLEQLQVFDARTGKPLVRKLEPLTVVQNAIFSADGKTLLSLGLLSQGLIWDLTTGKAIREIPNHDSTLFSAIIGPDRTSFVIAGTPPFGFRIIDARTGDETRSFAQSESSDALHFELCNSTNRTLVSRAIVDRATSEVAQWDARSGKLLKSVKLPIRVDLAFTFADAGKKRVHAVPNSTESCQLQVYDLFGEICLWTRSLAGNNVGSLAASPSSQIVAATSIWEPDSANSPNRRASIIQVWNLVTGEERVRVKRPARNEWDGFGQPLFSANGRVIVVPWAERTLLFYDALTGKELGQLKHDVGLKPLAFTPDGKRLATGVDDGTILIWEVGKFTFRSEKRYLSPGEIEMSWRDLAGEIRPAVEAMARLEESPSQALALFQERLKPAEPISAERTQALIRSLEDRSYAKREASTRELLRLGEQAHAALRSAYEAGPGAEARKRIEFLLTEPALVRSPEVRRHLRAIELTAAIGTPEAKALLAEWSKGDPAARETKAAKEALERLQP